MHSWKVCTPVFKTFGVDYYFILFPGSDSSEQSEKLTLPHVEMRVEKPSTWLNAGNNNITRCAI